MSRDTNCVLAACMDGTVRLLDRVEGDLLAEYTGAFSVALSCSQLHGRIV